ncbi:LytR/AlgR family response regulator transcription factor [Mucilaginibacter flavidus]|uniref:LytR/AlgR family response regulator transcription factor n=1 Tax=Mucilaginibacter flavidus TaxID=2949309 RepID=UPI0020938D8A|nr:LytTR family DNA-binding domain-containing protein [Mucilaginibacter flavidus]MCO5948137.1 LytTR family DNA-binding domain-containing protein [Mucilaginibacter flavidus]
MISAIAIDDEPIALDVLKTHAAKISFLDLKATFLSTTEAMAFLQQHKIDLILLDIRMPDLTGIEFASLVPKPVHIVFTTAYPEYAVKGFDLAATDYLLKPVSLSRLLQACTLVNERIVADKKPPEAQSLFVKDGYNLVKIDPSKITYIEAGDNYLSIYEGEKRTLTRMTLTELIAKLPGEAFQKVHKSYIVAIDKIEKIERGQVLVGGAKIPVSINFRDDLMGKVKL